MNGRRAKTLSLSAGVGIGALILLSWTQAWFTIALDDGQSLDVAGDGAAGGLAALGLSTLALVGALAIAGPVFRVILAVLAIAIGVVVGISATLALADPVAASGAAISAVTGVSGPESIRALVESVAVTAWPATALSAGVLLVALGVFVLVTSRAWPGTSRRFSAVRLEEVGAETSSSDVWDALSDGRDPTSGGRSTP